MMGLVFNKRQGHNCVIRDKRGEVLTSVNIQFLQSLGFKVRNLSLNNAGHRK